jgi:NAD(P)-dependent dehydrogenase (short-subunit alcohol dehydrogenase family)
MASGAATVGVVTGVGRGMGRACAQRIAPAVDTLVLVDRDPSGLADAGDELGAQAAIVPLAVDVGDRGSVEQLAVVGDHGRLTAVAHAAGVSPTMADWRTIVEVDLVGTALVMDALRPFVTEGTAAVCFASMAAHLLITDASAPGDEALDEPLHPSLLDRLATAVGPGIEDSGLAYAWAKRGVQRLARRLAIEWGEQGGRICSVSPGMIDTPQGRQEAASQPAMAVLLEHTPLHREGTADELAAVVAFLVSAEASFLTGTDILVDGGVVAAVAGLGGMTAAAS